MMFDEILDPFKNDLQRRNLKGKIRAINSVYYEYSYYYLNNNHVKYRPSSKKSSFDTFSIDGFLETSITKDSKSQILYENKVTVAKDSRGRIKTINQINSNGVLTKAYTFKYNDNEWVNCTVYFEENWRNLIINLRYSGGVLCFAEDQYHKYKFGYDENGNIVESNGDYLETFSYNENGNVLSYNGYAFDYYDPYSFVTYYQYEYDNDVNWTKSTLTSDTDGPKCIVYRDIFYY